MSGRGWLIAGLALFVTTGIGLAVAFVLAMNPFRSLPSDDALMLQFREHRAGLDELAAAALGDSSLVGAARGAAVFGFAVYVRDRIHFTRRLTRGELIASGRIHYEELLRRAGVPAVSRGPDRVTFTVGSNLEGRKGFCYSRRPLGPRYPSLDVLQRGMAGGYITSAYRELAPGWYLYLEASD